MVGEWGLDCWIYDASDADVLALQIVQEYLPLDHKTSNYDSRTEGQNKFDEEMCLFGSQLVSLTTPACGEQGFFVLAKQESPVDRDLGNYIYSTVYKPPNV